MKNKHSLILNMESPKSSRVGKPSCLCTRDRTFCSWALLRSSLNHTFLRVPIYSSLFMYPHSVPSIYNHNLFNSHWIVWFHVLFCTVSFLLLILTLSFTPDKVNALVWSISHTTVSKGLWVSEFSGLLFTFRGIHETDLGTFCTYDFLKHTQGILKYSFFLLPLWVPRENKKKNKIPPPTTKNFEVEKALCSECKYLEIKQIITWISFCSRNDSEPQLAVFSFSWFDFINW